jgi:hypothetical protein
MALDRHGLVLRLDLVAPEIVSEVTGGYGVKFTQFLGRPVVHFRCVDTSLRSKTQDARFPHFTMVLILLNIHHGGRSFIAL